MIFLQPRKFVPTEHSEENTNTQASDVPSFFVPYKVKSQMGISSAVRKNWRSVFISAVNWKAFFDVKKWEKNGTLLS